MKELNSAVDALRAERDALAKFKAFVHRRLDEGGVPADPPGEHRDRGCRVGQRLAWLFAERDALAAKLRGIEEADMGELRALNASLDASDKRAAALAEIVREIEWSLSRGAVGGPRCPVCGSAQRNGHDKGCRLVTALAGNGTGDGDGWIACETRMPGDGEHVLIYAAGEIGEGQEVSVFHDGRWWGKVKAPTHWRVLPERPTANEAAP